MLSLMEPIIEASLLKLCGIKASIFSRTNLANTGALPSLEIAISKGDRSIIDPIVKVQSAGSSTTLTGILRA